MRLFIFSICLISVALVVQGQDKMDSLISIIQDRGEVYVSFESPRYKSASQASILPGFDRYRGTRSYLYLTASDLDFIRLNLNNINILKAPSEQFRYLMADSLEQVLNGSAYATYPTYLEVMDYFRTNWPDICNIDTIGRSLGDRLILSARLEKPGNPGLQKPVFFYSGCIHGDETLGYSLLLMLIDELLNRNDETLISELLTNSVIYINPLSNPDGTFFNSDTTVFGSTRGNANGVDLNRNFPDPVTGNHPDGKSWQKETLAMMDYMNRIRPNLSANLHGGAEVINYPFDSYAIRHSDDAWFRFISSEYADTAMILRSGYMDDFPGGITNGYDWYSIHGGRQDYVTYFLQGREVTMELHNIKTTPEDQISGLWETNRSSMINYMRQSGYGLNGYVTDSLTGAPLEAEIYIAGHDTLNSRIYSDPERNGFFVRYLKEGVYTIKISAAGYKDYYLRDFQINDYQKRVVDIRMVYPDEPISELYVELTADPLSDEISLYIENPEVQEMKVFIYDLRGSTIFRSNHELQAGYNQININNNFGNGVYFIRLEFKDGSRIFKILKLRV